MQITLIRRYRASTYTIGAMYLDGAYFCDTLEDTDRDVNTSGQFDNGEEKIYGRTAIPYGCYRVSLQMSPKFNRILPYLHAVPHFSGILIHRGNTPADTAGCILVGENKVVGKVINSTPYEDKLVSLLAAAEKRGEESYITIKWKS